MVASAANIEQAGNDRYHSDHMGQIFKAGMSFSGFERDGLYLALGDGRFRDISGVSGIDSITDGRAAIFADFDNDGDLDVAVTTIQKEARLLYRNNVGQEGAFLRVALVGAQSGRDAFGAVARLKTARGLQTKIKAGGSGFLSAPDPRLLFGLGSSPAPEWLEVTWPSGRRERFTGLRSGDSLVIHEGAGRIEPVAEKRFALVGPEDPDAYAFRGLAVAKGQPAPTLRLTGIAGASTDLEQTLRPGRRTLVNFWATWCAPCREEMRELQRLSRGLHESGVDLIGISLDFNEPARVKAFLADTGVAYPIFIADESTMPNLLRGDSLGVPFSLLLDGEGRLVRALSGWTPATRKAIEELAFGATAKGSGGGGPARHE